MLDNAKTSNMKILYIIPIFVTLNVLVLQNAKSQNSDKLLAIFDNSSPQLASTKNDDVIVNKAMIANFKKGYDAIEVFPWGEYLTSPQGDFSAKYKAYIRIRLNNYSQKLEDAIAAEIDNMKNVKSDSTNFTLLAYAEKSSPTIVPLNMKTDKTEAYSNSSTATAKSSLKWITLKSK